MHPQRSKQAIGLAVQLAPIYSPTDGSRLSPKKNIFRHIQVRAKAEFLVNGCNPGLTGFERIIEMNAFSIEIDFAPIWLMNAGDYLDQRGFSRAVLA